MKFFSKRNLFVSLKIIGPIIAIIGLIVAFLAWWYPKQPKVTDKNQEEAQVPQTLHQSIYDLAKEISSEKFTIDRKEEIEKYKGLRVQDTGYIVNISEHKIPNSYFVSIVKEIEGTVISSDPKATKFPEEIYCTFSSKWKQTLLTTNFSDKISFEGIIDNDNGLIRLRDCKIKQN